MILLIQFFLLCIASLIYTQETNDSSVGTSNKVYKIEGKLFTHDDAPLSARYLVDTKILVNSGEYYGFLRPDGGFVVSGLAAGSYVIEVSNPTFFYEAVRVDITSKGKIRARKVNYIQVTEVKQLPYPLKFKAKAQFKYFHVRETWRITDLLINPMVLMMVVPLLLVMVLPKLVNQEELQQTQKELQSMPNLQNSMQDLPELSELMTNWYETGGKSLTGKMKSHVDQIQAQQQQQQKAKKKNK